jgi:hypothetical protein
MNIDFDEVRMLRDDYVDALRAENAALSAVSTYLNDGGKDVKELARLQAQVTKAYEATTRAGKAWNDRIAKALPQDLQS